MDNDHTGNHTLSCVCCVCETSTHGPRQRTGRRPGIDMVVSQGASCSHVSGETCKDKEDLPSMLIYH